MDMRKPKKRPAMRLGWRCPHCKGWATIGAVKPKSILTTELAFACRNIDCGHTFVGLLEIVRTLSPSSCPDLSVDLPLSPHVKREELSALMGAAKEDNRGGAFDPDSLPRQGGLFQGVPVG